jgi:superoxide dismutase, Fe-Mn family
MDASPPLPDPARRAFLRTSLCAGAATWAATPALFGAAATETLSTTLIQAPLPYGFDALEPAIDRETMEIHYSRHHAGYLNNVRRALESHSRFEGYTAEGLVTHLASMPEDIRETIRNNAGGHLNHAIFWSILAPPTTETWAPRSPLGRALRSRWNHREGFADALKTAALGVFGSGWAWLCAHADGTLFIATTPNQDNPLMPEAGHGGAFPVLGIDVWEHAYYLKYQNQRGAYLDAVIGCLNWEEANRRFEVRSFASRA